MTTIGQGQQNWLKAKKKILIIIHLFPSTYPIQSCEGYGAYPRILSSLLQV